MISDVLFSTERKLANYQRKMPEVYAPFSAEIEALKFHLQRVRQLLDQPPQDLVRLQEQRQHLERLHLTAKGAV